MQQVAVFEHKIVEKSKELGGLRCILTWCRKFLSDKVPSSVYSTKSSEALLEVMIAIKH
jgi:hypothetical protein